MKQATKKKNVHGQIIGNPKYNAGDKVQTTLTGNDVLTISPGSFHNGLSWMYYFDENEMGCGQDYILPYQPKDESREVREGGEGFTGGEWNPSATFHQMRSHLNGNTTLICSFDNQMDDTQANAALIAQSKNMYYALKPFLKLAQEVLDVKDHEQIIYEFNGAKITTEDLKNVLTVMFKANPKQ